jgi:hypothetical protein
MPFVRSFPELVLFHQMTPPERAIAVLIAIAACGTACYNAAVASLQVDTWAVGDWLINYGGGFVRRGLFGEFVVAASGFTGMGGQWLVLIGKVACYLAIYGAAIGILIRGARLSVSAALLLLSPAVLLFDPQNSLLAGRKELFLLAWAGWLAWKRATNRWDRDPSYLHLLVGWTTLTAIHEALLAFWPLFILYLYVLSPQNSYRPLWLALTAVPAAVVFLAGLPQVSPANLPSICAALGASAPEGCTLQGAIGLLNAGTDSAVARVINEFAPRSALTVAVAFILSVGFAGWVFYRDGLLHRMTHEKLWEAGAAVALSVAALSLLALVSVDWGRWIHVAATLAAFGVASRVAQGTDLSPPRRAAAEELSRGRLVLRRCLVLAGTAAAAAAYLLLWTLPYCCVRGASMSWLGPALAWVSSSLL